MRLADCSLGQRLAAQKGQSDDIVGAMNSQAKDEQLSDEDD